jgi:hypothetical protein
MDDDIYSFSLDADMQKKKDYFSYYVHVNSFSVAGLLYDGKLLYDIFCIVHTSKLMYE